MEVTGQLHVPSLDPQEGGPLSIEQEAGLISDLGWIFWRREKFLALLGFTILTTLSQL
jgi:hypothetical protein